MTPRSSATRQGSAIFDLQQTPIENGITLIEASAGTGKTYCLAGLVLRLLLERKVEHIGEILVVTFTNAATAELSGRIRVAVRDAHRLLSSPQAESEDSYLLHLRQQFGADGAEILRQALLDFDDLMVCTIHGFCKRVLEESAFESGLPFDAEFLESDEVLLLEAARDFWRRQVAVATSPSTTSRDTTSPSTMLPAVVVHQGWTPETFLPDYRASQRHPETRIEPQPLTLEAALERLTTARREMATAWSRGRMRLFLSRLPFNTGTELADAATRKIRLVEVDDFCRGRIDSLDGVSLLSSEALKKTTAKECHGEIERQAFIATCDLFFRRVKDLEHALRCAFIDAVGTGFVAAKEERAALAFDDLLQQLHTALKHPSHGRRLVASVRSRYGAALIDEFQDTDITQYDIFRRLFRQDETRPLFLIGDPKQAIYRFRGADIFAYLAAKADAKRVYTLEQNWRSSAPLVAAVNAVFSHLPHAFVHDRIPFQPVRPSPRGKEQALVGDDLPPLVWWWLEPCRRREHAVEQILDTLAEEVVRLLQDGPARQTKDGSEALKPGDLAVLVRTNQQALQVQERLRAAAVPAVVSRSGDIFHSLEMAELEQILAAVLEPGHRGRVRAACATVLWGATASGLEALSADNAWQDLVESLERYRTTWREQGFMPMMQQLIHQQGIQLRLLALATGERRLTNLLHCAEILHQAVHDLRLTASGLLAWLSAERRSREHDRESSELRLESDAMAVSIVTVHKAKGLEYEVVFCPFLWQARAVDQAPILVHVNDDEVVYDCGSKNLERHLALAEAERLAEELRLTYVALTRARLRCYIAWGAIGRGGSTAAGLAYLLHRRQGSLSASNAAATAAQRVALGAEEVAERRPDWRQDLIHLASQHEQIMTVRVIEEAADTAREDTAREDTARNDSVWDGSVGGPADELQARPWPTTANHRLRPWRITSFSGLSRGAAHELPDHRDAEADLLRRQRELAAAAPTDLFAFARGPRAGSCLHAVLEEFDFGVTSPTEAEVLVDLNLSRFHLQTAEAHSGGDSYDPRGSVLTLLDDLQHAELPGVAAPLAAIPAAKRLVEWQFFAPLTDLSASQLAAAFRDHAANGWGRDYAERLRLLDAERIRGFLTGFVDLIFEHDERWYIVDWKSNHLGNTAAEYGPESLLESMLEHHYVLQYHLYALALHRFLRQRLPGYDYRQHFGGACYVYLRGLGAAPAAEGSSKPSAPQSEPAETVPKAGQLSLFGVSAPETNPAAASATAPSTETSSITSSITAGVFFDCPSPELVDALERSLATAEAD